MESFHATKINLGDKPPISLVVFREQIIKQMQNMDQKEIENIADIIVGLIEELREFKNCK